MVLFIAFNSRKAKLTPRPKTKVTAIAKGLKVAVLRKIEKDLLPHKLPQATLDLLKKNGVTDRFIKTHFDFETEGVRLICLYDTKDGTLVRVVNSEKL
ncbi:MAG: hypothetical protein WCW13_05945 [archaeon]|jgi:hypothetical protein